MTRVARVTPFAVAYPEPNDAMGTRHLVFARVEAEDGTVGWGEGITQFAEATHAAARMIEGMADYVVGRDPMENVDVWRCIKDSTWWYGHRGGAASFALSAIDIALWDLKGKLLGQPLVNLIGGPHRTRLPAVASTHAFDASIEVEAERHRRYVEDGYVGVKVGLGKRGHARLGYEHARDVEFMGLLREAVGPEAWIMLDRGHALSWDLGEAIRRVHAFEELGLKWIEEPFEPDDAASFSALRQHVRCLIAGGEREWETRGFATAIERGTLDVVGCDVGRAEGVTGVLRIIQLIEHAGAWFNSHAWSSAVNTAASLALSASTPRCLLQELKPDPSPMQHELVEQPFAQVGGWIEVPRRPGLGVEVDERVLRRYRLT